MKKIETTYVPPGSVHRVTLRGAGWYAETATAVFGPFETEQEAIKAAKKC